MRNKIIPSFISFGNLIAGFVSLLFTMNGQFTKAAFMIILGMLFDGVDGLAARKLKVQSEFGKEIDSLSDLVSFGIAPSVLAYSLYFNSKDFIGLIAVVFFVVCSALRLGKFNLKPSKGFFVGLPITIAGGFIASFVICNFNFSHLLLSLIIITLACLMISSIHYPKFEYMIFHLLNYYKLLTTLLISILILLINPKELIFLPLLIYILYGVVTRILRGLKVLHYEPLKEKDSL